MTTETANADCMLSSGLAMMTLNPRTSRAPLHEPRSGSIRSRSRGQDARLTSEEREILRARDETEKFRQDHDRWNMYYHSKVKPTFESHYQEQIDR